MNRIIPAAAALALALSLPGAAAAQNQGNGRGGDDARHAERGKPDKGGGQDRADRGDRGRGGGEARGRGQDRGGRDDRPSPSIVRDMARGGDSRGRGDDRGPDRSEVRELVRPAERDGRRLVAVDDGGPVALFRDLPDRGLIEGCPPGLAKRNNGCLPPGQARKIERARYDWLWNLRNDDNLAYRYDDGVLYRINDAGSVMGWLPVLGGALSPGNVWPAQYSYRPVSPYYVDYFGLNNPYDYRYANGALYGVDPRTQAISQVAALLTGQPISVGQVMPAGYDVYNVPYAYRTQYADTPEAMYRYSDGYVYRVDPTTQLVQAAIQLLT